MERLGAPRIGSIEGGRCHIIFLISRMAKKQGRHVSHHAADELKAIYLGQYCSPS
jgi:hypothetical protein